MSSAALGDEIKWTLSRSQLFRPAIAAMESSADSFKQRGQRVPRRQRGNPHVKIGHGGTLDPSASGVIAFGIGKGTKALEHFTKNSTKGYECVMLLGVATDMFDADGSVVGRKSWKGVTRQKVEEALEQFRGKIMQRPSVYSALKRGGTPMYEYARAGKEIPELEKREMFVHELEVVEWMDGGTHEYHWPEAEIGRDRKEAFVKVLRFDEIGGVEAVEGAEPTEAGGDGEAAIGQKRKNRYDHGKERRLNPTRRDHDVEKRLKLDDGRGGNVSTIATAEHANVKEREEDARAEKSNERESTAPEPVAPQEPPQQREPCPAPAVKLRMTVSSGFYVRSLCHDLGVAVGSLGIMSKLVRTKQACFEMGGNVLDYGIFEQGEDVWGPKVAAELDAWEERYKKMLVQRREAENEGKKDRS